MSDRALFLAVGFVIGMLFAVVIWPG